jgi:hypothetical protein
VFTPPRPLSPQVIDVTGADLAPLASALAIVALACLAAVIATRGVLRRVSGVLLAAFGAGAAISVATGVSAASVLSVAAGKVGSPGAAAVSGAAGSATGGSSGGSGIVSVVGSTRQAIMTGTPWRVAVLAGALLIVAAGVATAWRGPGWPVMSARYDAPGSHDARRGSAQHAASAWDAVLAGDTASAKDTALAGEAVVAEGTVQAKDTAPAGGRGPATDSASMWEALSAGGDPTDAP